MAFFRHSSDTEVVFGRIYLAQASHTDAAAELGFLLGAVVAL
jgi:hypothetical protein